MVVFVSRRSSGDTTGLIGLVRICVSDIVGVGYSLVYEDWLYGEG